MEREPLKYFGVDGCRAGWFWVGMSDTSAWQVGVTSSLGDLLGSSAETENVLVDIPIGLRTEGPEERKCDLKAREVLGPRGRSVFPVPCRPAVYAASPEAASDLNEELTGRRLSSQAWGIAGKIREVDQLLQRDTSAREVIREVHPEVCFWALNGSTPLDEPKSEPRGLVRRLEILRRHDARAGEITATSLLKYRRTRVARDDVLDALAAAITARHPDRSKSLPASPEIDEQGLPMQMIYWAPSQRE